jgi:hypothetical protein
MAIRVQRHNLILALCVAAVAIFLFRWGRPYMAQWGHGKLCIGLYLLLLLIYVYGRASAARQSKLKG